MVIFRLNALAYCLKLVWTLGSVSSASDFPLLMPHVRPTENETYLCTAFRVASRMHKYVVAFKPNATMHLVHHMLVYGCRTPGYREWDSPRVVWDCDEMSTSRTPFPKGPICQTGSQVVYGWARNAPPLQLPEGVGLKFGGNSGVNFLVIQVHYADTTSFQDGITRDSSGVVLSVVPGNDTGVKRRAGVYDFDTGGMIPANSHGQLEAACRINENVTLHPFAFRVHTHALGKAVTGYVVRNGNWTNVGKHDPLEPQMFYPAKKGLTIVKGDILAVRCTLKNFRNRDTYVGPTSEDEMCNFYMMYYTDGDKILEDNLCYSKGSPTYYWKTDPMLKDHVTPEIDEDASTLD
ncbi:peptidylglycine alpha-hydroxylating monooxygenase-like [Ixodes scapularis]